MKISLINPVVLSFGQAYDSRAAGPPLGILYLASVLKKDNYGLQVIDQAGEWISDSKLINKIKKFNPDVVGFSTLTATGRRAAEQAYFIKKWNPNLKIVIGGYHSTINGHKVLKKYPFIDYAIRGEGEISFPKLLKAIKEGEKASDLKNINGLIYRQKEKIKEGPPDILIKNLDDLSFPDRTFILNNDYGYISNFKMPKFTFLLTSRGCPYKCSYCSCAAFMRRKWMSRSAENILDEMEEIVSLGYKNVLITDDNYTLNKKRVIAISKGMKKRKIDLCWIAEGRVDSGSYETFKAMTSAGCKIIYLGVESGNQRILDYYNKGTKVDQAITAVNNARKAGMDIITATFILGAPTETISEVINTLKFAQKLDIDFPQFNILAAIPGAKIYEDLVKAGYINPEKSWEYAPNVASFHPNCIPENKLNELILKYYKSFVFRKGFIFNEISRTLSSIWRWKLITSNITQARGFINQLTNTFSTDAK
jgi:anaerobic magnesium-protoporphyrin IX monomethyl ester cyclase